MMLLRMERCGSHKTARYPTQPSLIQPRKEPKPSSGSGSGMRAAQLVIPLLAATDWLTDLSARNRDRRRGEGYWATISAIRAGPERTSAKC